MRGPGLSDRAANLRAHMSFQWPSVQVLEARLGSSQPPVATAPEVSCASGLRRRLHPGAHTHTQTHIHIIKTE